MRMPETKRRPAAPTVQPKPVAEEPIAGEAVAAPKEPSRLMRLMRRVGLIVLTVLALAAAYVFLLLGEPDEDAKYMAEITEEVIQMPMSALESPGETNVQNLAETFGHPVLSLTGGLTMQKARIYDTAFSGGYARRVTLTYAFEDGQTLTVESIRPTAASTLLHQNGYTLDASALYTLGGLNAARMENDRSICVFAQSDTAVYAVVCPAAHAADLPSLLRYTMLVSPD